MDNYLISWHNLAHKDGFDQESKKCSLLCPKKQLINANFCVPSQHANFILGKKQPTKSLFQSGPSAAKYFHTNARIKIDLKT